MSGCVGSFLQANVCELRKGMKRHLSRISTFIFNTQTETNSRPVVVCQLFDSCHIAFVLLQTRLQMEQQNGIGARISHLLRGHRLSLLDFAHRLLQRVDDIECHCLPHRIGHAGDGLRTRFEIRCLHFQHETKQPAHNRTPQPTENGAMPLKVTFSLARLPLAFSSASLANAASRSLPSKPNMVNASLQVLFSLSRARFQSVRTGHAAQADVSPAAIGSAADCFPIAAAAVHDGRGKGSQRRDQDEDKASVSLPNTG